MECLWWIGGFRGDLCYLFRLIDKLAEHRLFLNIFVKPQKSHSFTNTPGIDCSIVACPPVIQQFAIENGPFIDYVIWCSPENMWCFLFCSYVKLQQGHLLFETNIVGYCFPVSQLSRSYFVRSNIAPTLYVCFPNLD